jgi:hypothetical protein
MSMLAKFTSIVIAAAVPSCTPIERQVLPPAEEDAGAAMNGARGANARGGPKGGNGGGNTGTGGNAARVTTGSGTGSAANGGSNNSSGGNGSSSRGAGKGGAPNGGAGGSSARNQGSGGSSSFGDSNGEGGEADGNGNGNGSKAGDVSEGCPPQALMCDDTCVPNDIFNCGECGHDCSGLQNVTGKVTCSGGACAIGPSSCLTGFANCSDDPETGCETDITQPDNCGKCRVVCEDGTPVCSKGKCVSGCPDSTPTLCGGSCADTDSDPMHCGECDNPCTTKAEHAQPVCERGECGFECAEGFMQCFETCVDLEKDNANCGSCNNKCTGGKMCQKGSCECPKGLNDCGGTCKADSPQSCGSSCEVCRSEIPRAKDTCDKGQCGYECSDGLSLCRGECIDTSSDDNNCGLCGIHCASPKSCGLGLCLCPLGQHDCYGTCVTNADSMHCGLFSCSACPATTPYCDGFQCTAQ